MERPIHRWRAYRRGAVPFRSGRGVQRRCDGGWRVLVSRPRGVRKTPFGGTLFVNMGRAEPWDAPITVAIGIGLVFCVSAVFARVRLAGFERGDGLATPSALQLWVFGGAFSTARCRLTSRPDIASSHPFSSSSRPPRGHSLPRWRRCSLPHGRPVEDRADVVRLLALVLAGLARGRTRRRRNRIRNPTMNHRRPMRRYCGTERSFARSIPPFERSGQFESVVGS